LSDNGRGRVPYVMLAAAVVLLDQVTKVLVDRAMELHESRPIVEGLLSLTYVRNRGGAFGMFSDADLPYQSILFSLVSLAAFVAIVSYAWKLPAAHRLPQAGLGLIMGGAIGNLIDRARLGYVIDFVDAYWGSHHWPAFNVADSAISIGVTLLVLDVLREPRAEETHPAAAPAGRSAVQGE
jgi:signal peptidase II